jgi:cystathionine beta-synthase
LKYAKNVLDLVGNTPLVRLNKVTSGVKPTILAKLESLNPGGSVKDRIGISMLADAERRGFIHEKATIVEPSSGNTGVGLAIACIMKGYSLIVTMPDKMSQEKKRLLESYGAKVIVCPTEVPPGHPEHYVSVAKRICESTPNSFMPNQYDNPSNPLAHYATTGREIWDQTDGKLSCLVSGIGTGGTISGVGKYLKERNKEVRIVGVDPEGSILKAAFYKENDIKPKVYMIEGIGEDFVPGSLDMGVIDSIVAVSDKESYAMARRLAREEALLVGSSSGAAVAGAIKVAQEFDSEDLLVTILPDRGDRYLSKLYDDEWMKSKGFL